MFMVPEMLFVLFHSTVIHYLQSSWLFMIWYRVQQVIASYQFWQGDAKMYVYSIKFSLGRSIVLLVWTLLRRMLTNLNTRR